MTKSLHRHCTFKTVLERKRRRSGFLAEMQRREERRRSDVLYRSRRVLTAIVS